MCKEDKETYRLGTCLLTALGGSDQHLIAGVQLAYAPGDSVCVLSRRAEGGMPLMHSADCPCFAYFRREGQMFERQKTLKLCACAIVESADERLLLTRRDARMKFFAKAWVFPGGHVEQGESVEQAVLREIREETGLAFELREGQAYLEGQPCTCHPFLLYESVFPSLLEAGLPQSQNLIIFYHIRLQQTATSLQVLNSSEVDVSIWLSHGEMQRVLTSQPGQVPGIPRDSPACVVDFAQLSGSSPNALGEGLGRAHSLALRFLLGIT